VLNAGDFRYLVVTTSGFPFLNAKTPQEQRWTSSDPAARLLIHEVNSFGQAWLYRIDGRLNPARCDHIAPSATRGP
jgi:hypothetical protein